MIFETVFRLRIIYKSGYTMDFDVTDYEISTTKMSWTSADADYRPINMNYDEVAAVWKIGQRRRLKFSRK